MGYGKKAGKGSQSADSWADGWASSRGWETEEWQDDDWSAGKTNGWATASQTKAAPRKGKSKGKTKGKG